MKKSFVTFATLGLLVASFTLTSCNKKAEETPVEETPIEDASAVVDSAAAVVDSAAVVVDSAAAAVAPATAE
jgi:uncharacterized lipoprotein YajG